MAISEKTYPVGIQLRWHPSPEPWDSSTFLSVDQGASSGAAAVDVFGYMDYHDFLRDWVLSRKTAMPSFSFQALANRAGLKSRSFLRLVSLGQKDLSSAAALAVAKAMGLGEVQTEFFVRLVEFNNASDPLEKARHSEQLDKARPASPGRILSAQHYDLFGKWYIPPVWDLVTWFDFREDYSLLARQLRPEIRPEQAREALELLLELGLVEPHGRVYRQRESNLQTRQNLKSQAVKRYQTDTMLLGQEALERFDLELRHIGTITLGLDARAWEKLKVRIHEFRKELVALAEQVERSDRVCQVNLQAFPLTTVVPDPGECV